MPTIVGYDETKKLRCTCRNCTAIVEYVPNDILEGKAYDYTGGYDVIDYIKCPGCGKDIDNVKRYA